MQTVRLMTAAPYEEISEADIRDWLDELASKYPAHPLLAECECMAERYLHLQRFTSRLASWSDKQSRKVIEKNNQLAERAATDPLTELLNRRSMEDQLARATQTLAEDGTQFGLLMIDLDHFKKINDCYGHQIGDEVLVQASQAMRQSLRNERDVLARWGGEEFLALIPVDDEITLMRVAGKLLAALRGIYIKYGQDTIHPTASIGVYFCTVAEPVETSVNKADKAMYHAKQSGRNQVASLSHP